MLTQDDLHQIAQRGILQEKLQHQIDNFVRGFPPIRLSGAATAGDGIFRFSEPEKHKFIQLFRECIPKQKVVKFVPASGAASRMFKHLFEFREKYRTGESGRDLFRKDRGFNSVAYLMEHIQEIAFFADLEQAARLAGTSLEDLIRCEEYGKIITLILEEPGLDYGNLPKGLLKFHNYPDGARTAIEEHLVEAVRYARDASGVSRIHLTVSPEHRQKFEALLYKVMKEYEMKYKVLFDISFSLQKPSTDTIAVDEDNQPFRNADGSLHFRPGGHGALLENLQDITADIIFIKNIDNIVPDRLREPTVEYKQLIGGYLCWMRERIHGYLKKAMQPANDNSPDTGIMDFMKKSLSVKFPSGFDEWNDAAKKEWVFRRLNRPIRVCGMVKNEGEPGGGPFWTIDDSGEESLQIVESSQIDIKDPEQNAIMQSATHFNPVDLVCCTTDFRGKQFDLKQFVDEKTGFISLKSTGGRTLKAQELPGLWNGAMGEWITVFVEVPIITFNPVKTVNDLLRKEHLKE